MPSKDSITKTVRISANDLAVFKEIMDRKNLSWSGAVHFFVTNHGKQISKTDNGISQPLYKDLMSMVKTFGMTYEQFMTEIDRFLNDGYIVNDGGRLKTIDSKLDTSEFVAKCEELGIKDYQSMFDRIVKQIKVN